MLDPLRIDESSENMNGAYTVLSISSTKMHIRYENGSQATVDIVIQARIWERIQDELAFAQQEYERRTKVNRPKVSFSGLTESDFKDNVTGTNWRSREGLAGLVSKQLSDLSGKEYTSVAIYRRPQFFVYPPQVPMFNQEEGVKLPKFVVQLNLEAVLYGFYIEKSDKYMESDWYWPRFLELLSETQRQDNIERTMSEWKLNWILRFEERIDGTDNYTLSTDTIISSFDEGTQFPKFSDFVAHLHGLSDQQWCNLFIAKTMGKQEGIVLQEKISRPISQTLNALVPLYSQLLLHPGMDA